MVLEINKSIYKKEIEVSGVTVFSNGKEYYIYESLEKDLAIIKSVKRKPTNITINPISKYEIIIK